MVKSMRENLKNIKENEEKDRNDSMASERSEDPSDETKSKNLVEHLNKTYINIRDHQKNIGETTDIPEYDPNKIPYVEVPDYSDIREESLDEEDRKANKKKKKQQNVDFLDPSVSINIDKPENNNEYNLSKGFKNDSNKKQKNPKESAKSLDINKDMKENSKSLNKEDKFAYFPQNLSINFNDRKLEIFKNSKKPSKSSRMDNFKRNKNESRKGSKQKSNDSEKSRFKELAFDDESDRESQGDPEGQGKSTSPIIFDINEYRKPFDLDEFLKDDPIMKKLESLGKETLSKYGKNGKRVSGDFNESESDNAPEKRSGTVEEREDGDYSSKFRQSNDFAETLTERHDQNNDTAKEPRNKVNQGSEGSKLLRFLFKDKDKYLTKHLEDDIIRNFQKDEKKENSEIGISRLNEDIDKGIETGDESGLVYKNFWSLEFKSPQKKVDMEAQERKK
ncbi:surfeit locus protein 6 homolog [Osmia bicornis bicornis]|uniref:surfeit locus protein 6 homolog n=1 Tax=Osmia bicornis bicornis TaxID=1437191 RepID=UPI001EAEA12D|nr:surfeit locus protein 6 homolog [Osmia bicornis bicornis]